MSEARRRSETTPVESWAQQGPEPLWTPPEQGIDPSEAAEFRRRLDYQGSAELIPLAGPDAPADQGPAIKAVWEPAPPGAPGQPSSRASRRRERPAANRTRRRRRRTLIVSALIAGGLSVAGYTELDSSGPTLTKGAATTILPVVSSSPDGAASASSSLGTGISLVNLPSPSRSPSRSASPTASRSKPAGGGGSVPPSAPPTTVPGSPSPGGPSPSFSPAPSPSPSPSPRSCFLIFCT